MTILSKCATESFNDLSEQEKINIVNAALSILKTAEYKEYVDSLDGQEMASLQVSGKDGIIGSEAVIEFARRIAGLDLTINSLNDVDAGFLKRKFRHFASDAAKVEAACKEKGIAPRVARDKWVHFGCITGNDIQSCPRVDLSVIIKLAYIVKG